MKRVLLAIALAVCLWAARRAFDERARERAEAEPPRSVADIVAAEAGAYDGVALPADEAEAPQARPEPIADPVVHCAVGDSGTFVRESACLAGGGRVEEPEWARLD